MTVEKKVWILAGAAALLALSIKFFPYHCNCQAPQTAVLPASTRTAEVSLGAYAVRIGTTTLSVELADTPALQEQGLSGRTSLCADCGMLFIFKAPGTPGFWMKEMNFALDIIWISPEGRIVGVEKSLTPATYPNIYFPPSPITEVLEVPAGTYDRNNFKIGEPVVTVSQK